MNSDDHAIRQDLKLLNDNNNKSFLLLTKCIIDMQTQNLFNLLNVASEYIDEPIFTVPIFVLDSDKYHIISQIYKQHNIFMEIKKYTNKTTKIKKLTPILNNMLETIDEKKSVRNFFNAIILVNVIKKNLKNKLETDMNNYNLQEKLNKIDPDLLSILSLSSILKYNKTEQMQEFIENYTYQNINMNYFLNINDDDYNKIYNEFYLFK
jgi:hypothetical protein